MKYFILKYKKSIFQFIGLTIGYLITRSSLFIGLLVFFSLLIIFSPKIYFKFSNGIDAIINFIGNSIKSILFFLLYIFIITPISVLQKLIKRKNTKERHAFVELNRKIIKEDLEKMW